jgi:anti-sigma regulatory factor (Ser/Thr protein kinase)
MSNDLATVGQPRQSSPRWSVMLPRDVPAVRTARASVERWLEGHDQRLCEEARAIVTELVANAVQYGRPPIELSLHHRGDALRIVVADAGARRPHETEPDERGGWGLRIVGGLSARWGIEEDASTVWCELPAAG